MSWDPTNEVIVIFDLSVRAFSYKFVGVFKFEDLFEGNHCFFLDIDYQDFRRSYFASWFNDLLYVLMDFIEHWDEVVLGLAEVA